MNRKIESVTSPHTFEKSKTTIKNSTNQAYREPLDRSSQIEQTSRLQAETASKSRIKKIAEKVTPDEVLQKVREILEKSSESARKADINDMERKELATKLYTEMVENQLAVRFDTEMDKLVTRLVRKTDGDVVWQFPPEESINLKKLVSLIPGMTFDQLA